MKVKKLEDFLNEEIEYTENAIIEIEKEDDDERAPRRKNPKYHFSYLKEIDGETIEFDGSIDFVDTGRSKELHIEADWFADDESENYYDENWEDISDEIEKVYYEKF